MTINKLAIIGGSGLYDVEDFKNREQLVQEITSEEKDLHQNFLKKDLPKSSMLN